MTDPDTGTGHEPGREPTRKERRRRRRPSIRRRMFRLILTVFVLAGLWTAVWYTTAYYARSYMVEGYRSAGLSVACQDPEVTGYPISIELSCKETDAKRALGQSVSLGGIRAFTSLSDPGGLTAEIASPAVVSPAPGFKVEADWSKAKATAKLTTQILKMFEAEVADFVVKPAAAFAGISDVSLKHGRVQVRQNPDNPADAEAFVAIEGLTGIRPGLGTLDLALALRLPDGVGLLSRQARNYLASRLGKETKLHIDRAFLTDAVVAVTAKGDLVLDGEGRLNGEMTIAVVNPDEIAGRIPDLTEVQQKALTALQGAIKAFGKKGTDDKGTPTKTIKLIFTGGAVRAGLIPLGRIPPLFGRR